MDYTKYSWDELVAEITRLLEDHSSHPSVWRDRTHSSTAQVLIQLMAAMTERLHYTLERRVQESYLTTARLQSSIYALAGSLGYRASRMVASSGYVQLVLDHKVTTGHTITLPPYTRITHNGQPLITLTETQIHQGVDQVSIRVIEGVKEQITIDVSTGAITNPTDKDITWDNDLHMVIIRNPHDIAERSISIRTVSGGVTVDQYYDVYYPNPVTGEPPKGAISLSGPTDPVYDIRWSHLGMQIVFGDDTFGRKPTGELEITWVSTSGPKVSISSTYTAAVDVVDNTTTSKSALESQMTTTGQVDGVSVYDGMRILCNGFASDPRRIYLAKQVGAIWSLVSPEDVSNRLMTYVKYGSEAGKTYQYSNGSWSPQPQPDQITMPDYPVLQDNASPIPGTYQYVIQNTTPISGGLDAEDTSSVKRYAPDWVKTGNRAVTKHDYRYYTVKSGIGGIVDAVAYGEEEIGINPYGWTSNNVWVTYLTKDKTELSNQDKQALMDWLNQYKQVTSIIVLQAANRVLLSIKLYYQPNQHLTISDQQTVEYIRGAIDEYFEAKDGSIGKDAEHSDLVQWIHNYDITDVGGITKRLVESVTIEIRLIRYYDFTGKTSIDTEIPVPVLSPPTPPKDYIVRQSITATDTSGGAITVPYRAMVVMDHPKRLTDATGLSTSITYETVIQIGGTNHTITINGSNTQTYNGLITELETAIQAISSTTQIGLSGHIMLYDGSNTLGVDESGLTNPLFASLTDYDTIVTDGTYTNMTDNPVTTDLGMFGVGLINYRTGKLYMINDTYLPDEIVVTYSQDDRQNAYAGPDQVLDVDDKTLQIIKV